jgi:putative ABC transport system permease protein
MADAWKRLEPYAPFEHFFQDTVFDGKFRDNRSITNLYAFEAFIALLIACLGLFGLASQNLADRLKEIGVRKVLGGSVAHIAWVVNTRFLLLLGFAALIAAPVSYVLVNAWLDDTYAYHVEVGPGAFFIAYGLVFLTVLLTISTQARRLAAVNPAEVLRNE